MMIIVIVPQMSSRLLSEMRAGLPGLVVAEMIVIVIMTMTMTMIMTS